jgi:hypothetical protein
MNEQQHKRRTGLVAGVGIVTAVLTLSGCISGGSGTTPVPDTAAVTARYVWNVGPDTPRCTMHLTWVFTPISLTGTAGGRQTVTKVEDYDVSAGASETCVFEAGELGMATGRWRMDLLESGQTCELELTGGLNAYVVRHGQAGCAPGYG